MTNFKIIAKYIKDIEFKIPNTKTFFMLSKDISKYKINIDITSNKFKEKFIEVEIMLSLSSASIEQEKIKTQIIFSAIVELNSNIKDKKELEKIILIHVPKEVYPEIRKTFIFFFEMSGFKDIKIEEKVDFQKLYLQKKSQ
tara:strand:- start:1053 stop:1475 length:423 start_codon:yes stop_codon:yes gene_type:complete